jgi:hypothetical protein
VHRKSHKLKREKPANKPNVISSGNLVEIIKNTFSFTVYSSLKNETQDNRLVCVPGRSGKGLLAAISS